MINDIMLDILKEWIPIIISLLALFLSVFNALREKKRNVKDEQFKNWQVNFEATREQVRQQEKQYESIVLQLNSRANLIPYFQLVLDDEKVKFEETKVILGIKLVNIGKQAASNVRLKKIGKIPKFDTGQNYFITEDQNINSHRVYNYLDKYYAMPKEEISFEIVNPINEVNNKERYLQDNLILHFVRFKIGFQDLIGNEYEQEFRFGYDNKFVNGFNRNNTSHSPLLVKNYIDSEMQNEIS